MIIIGITGTDGAGKGTVVEHLVAHHDFTHYSSRETIAAVAIEHGLPITRQQLRLTANELRGQFGDDYVVRRSYEAAIRDGATRIIIESVRTIAEADFLRTQGAIMLAVDADPAVRYERVQARRSETDRVSYETFLNHEALEANDPDPHGMQKIRVMAGADTTIFNNGSVTELTTAVDAFIANYIDR